MQAVGDAGPYALLAGLFGLTAILGQLISNTATALIMIPIAVAAAIGMRDLPAGGADEHHRRGGRAVPHARRHPGESHRDGPGRTASGTTGSWGCLLLWFFVVATFLVPVFWPF